MSLKSLLKQAKKYIASGEYEDARDQCNYILELENDNYTALTFLGLAEFNLGEYNDSINFKTTLKMNDKDTALIIQGRLKIFDFIKLDENLINRIEFIDLPGLNRKDGEEIDKKFYEQIYKSQKSFGSFTLQFYAIFRGT